uniref:Uncharacterized protein n=1 Tax=Romanomermis culicivorax TaxID=13658 RepID=A0A915JSY2_ROMCU
MKNHVAMVTLCLGKGIAPNTKIVTKRYGDSKNVQQALHIACTKDYRALAYLLLQFGADVNALDSDNCTPLMNAVINNNMQLVELLLYYKARTDISVSILQFLYVASHHERY